MDRLCDSVSALLTENKELSARLRNLEYSSNRLSSRRSVASITGSKVGPDHYGIRHPSKRGDLPQSGSRRSHSTSSRSSRSVASDATEDDPTWVSAYEEQLHRSRVYRHAHANNSDSSLLDDGRSTFALSICSSLTLGEVSNIFVFALPIFAIELSNASIDDFARPAEQAKLADPDEM